MNEPQPYILLIDDDEDDCEMFSSGLEKKGIRVKVFQSPEKALFYLTLMTGNNEMPALILLDYNMPRKTGLQVLSLLKENVDTKSIPVVLYSTGMSDLLMKKLSDAGALNSFAKPWTFLELSTQVDMLHEQAYSFRLSQNLSQKQTLAE